MLRHIVTTEKDKLNTSNADFNTVPSVLPTIEEVVQECVCRGFNKDGKRVRDDGEGKRKMWHVVIRVQSLVPINFSKDVCHRKYARFDGVSIEVFCDPLE